MISSDVHLQHVQDIIYKMEAVFSLSPASGNPNGLEIQSLEAKTERVGYLNGYQDHPIKTNRSRNSSFSAIRADLRRRTPEDEKPRLA